MSVLGTPVLINPSRAYWLSSIGNDVIHSTIKCQEIDANIGRISTLFGENVTASTLNASTLTIRNLDVSGMIVSSLRGNNGFFSTLNIASDLSGGLGRVRFQADASGVVVSGDPIRFNNLVFLTSTINIVQVSTLVDTDVFSQSGFFSSLSSGSISTGLLKARQAYISSINCEDISGTNGSFNRLTVSSLEVIDISGLDSAKNWSLFPTLNSSIIFQPGNVLSNVGNELFFDGVRLTDASGGGSDWSRFPAFSTVLMSNNSLTGISTLFFQDGGRLTSQTGNNLLYNGQPIQAGAAGNVANWAQFPANTNVNLSNRNVTNGSNISAVNLALSGSNITNGNTFTNSLGVGGLSLVPLASITSGGDIFCRNLDVGDSTTSLGDLNVYGTTAAPGDNALYVEGGTTLTGGTTGGIPVHGTEIGAAPILGIDSMRIDVLPVGIGINAATYVQLAAAGAGSFAAGGALSLAGGDYVEINTDDCRIINTTSGNQSTTLTVANIQMPPSVAATVPLQINNTSGGINLVGSSGKGLIAGFSTITGDRMISPQMSTVNINLSTINGLPIGGGGGGIGGNTFSTIVVSTLAGFGNSNNFISTLNINALINFIGSNRVLNSLQTINSLPLGLAILGSTISLTFSEGLNPNGNIRLGGGGAFDTYIKDINGLPGVSTLAIECSTINGQPPGSGGGGGGNIFSTLVVSTLSGFGDSNNFVSTLNINSLVNFTGSNRGMSSVNFINSLGEDFRVDASTMSFIYNQGLNPRGGIRLGGGGAFDTYILTDESDRPAIYTNSLRTNLIQPSTTTVLDISGVVNINSQLNTFTHSNTLSSFTNVMYVYEEIRANSNINNFVFAFSVNTFNLKMSSCLLINDITGFAQGVNPLQTRLVNFSSIQSGTISTINLVCSTINGQPPGGGGGGGGSSTFTSTFSTLFVSTLFTDTIYSYPSSFVDLSGGLAVSDNIYIPDGKNVQFDDGSLVTFTNLGYRDVANVGCVALTNNPGVASNNMMPLGVGEIRITPGADQFGCARLYSVFPGANFGLDMVDENGNTLFSAMSILDTGGFNYQTNIDRIGYLTGFNGLIDMLDSVDISGDLLVKGIQRVPLGNVIQFDDGSTVTFTNIEYRDIANFGCVSFTNNPGLASNNMMPIGVGEVRITPGADQYGCARLYSVFPGANFGLDMVDDTGATVFSAISIFDTGGFNYQTNIEGIGYLGGHNGNIDLLANVGITGLLDVSGTILTSTISTQALLVSSINGAPYTLPVISPFFSTLFTSSFQFSTATSIGSNANSNYPIQIQYDNAGNTSTAQVAISVAGTDLATISSIHQLEFGTRYGVENYIKSYIPNNAPNNLDELFVDAIDFKIFDGTKSTIINLDPYGLLTEYLIQGPAVSTIELNVSTINNREITPAYTNNIQLSSMELFAGSTTVLYWDNVTAADNISTAGTQIQTTIDGVFKIGVSVQFDNRSGSDEVEIFFIKNFSVIPNAGGIVTVENNVELLSYIEIVEPLLATDKMEVGLYTANTFVYASTIQGAIVESPAAILTMYRVDV